MKHYYRLVQFLVFLFAVHLCLGQQAVISTDNTKVLYFELENVLTVAVPQYSNEQLVLKCSDATFIRKGNTFLLRMDTAKNDLTKISINIYVTEKEGTEHLFETQEFKVLHVPMPEVLLNGEIRSGRIHKDDLKKITHLNLKTDFLWLPMDTLFKINSFSILYQPKNGLARVYRITGNNLSDDHLVLLENALNGDLFVFTDIQIQMPDGREKKYPTSILLDVIK